MRNLVTKELKITAPLSETVEYPKSKIENPKLGEFRLLLPYLLFLLLLKAAVAIWLYRLGYLEYDGDGFTRSLHAWEWLQKPRFEIDAWLPLQFWLNGTLMRFWPDLFFEPRIVNMVASCVTVLNFFFIGRWLFGKWHGYATAALVAVFPWEIWFGMSGMAESMTHMFLSAGVLFFVGWLRFERDRFLLFASFGFMGATMLRYEAWFYSLVYAGLVLLICYRRRHFRWYILPMLALAFAFAALWMLVSWRQKGSPFAFVSITSEINAVLEDKNSNLSFWERLIFYPKLFLLDLMPRLSVLAVAGSLLLTWKKTNRAALVYLALVWGELAVFILSTLPFNNIAPGSARYPVSNLMLLLPVVVWLFGWFIQLWPQRLLQAAIAAIFLLLAASFIQTTLDRPLSFPDGANRQLVLKLKELTEDGTLPANIVIPAHLPNPASENGGDYGNIYTLTVLTNRPDGWRFPQSKAQGLRVISEIEGFERTILDDKPLAWLHIKSAGDEDRINALRQSYRFNLEFGPYTLSYSPLNRPLEVAPKEGATGQTFVFQGDGFEPGEKVAVWLSLSATEVRNQPDMVADARGRVRIEFVPRDIKGTMALTARGDKSGRRAIAEITVR